MTLYDNRRALAREVRDYLDGRSGAQLCKTTIRASARMAECYGHHQTIFDYAVREGVTDDYARLAEEVQSYVTAR